MIGGGLARGLARKAAIAAGAAGAAFVAVAAMGATIYHALLFLLPPLGAAAITALIFALVAGLLVMNLTSKSSDDEEEDDEPAGLGERAFGLFKERPVLGTVAALAGGWIFLRNPALASLVAAAFTERRHGRGSRGRH